MNQNVAFRNNRTKRKDPYYILFNGTYVDKLYMYYKGISKYAFKLKQNLEQQFGQYFLTT